MTPSQIMRAVGLAADLARPSTMPIMSNLLIGNGKAIASDSDSQITISAPFNFDPYTVPAAKFKTILATLDPDSTLKLDHKDGKLSVKSGRSKFSVQTLPAEDYPQMEIGELISSIEIHQEVLKSMLHDVQHAIPAHDVRQYINGAFLSVRDGQLTVVGTDTARMAVKSIDFDNEEVLEVTIPKLAVGRLIKFLNDGLMTINFYDDKLVFAMGDIEFTTKLVTGKFPDFRRVIPKNPNTILIDRELMLETLSRATTVLDKMRSSKVTIGTSIEVACSNNGEIAVDDFPCTWTGEPIEFGMNPDFLREALHVMRGDEVSLSFGAANAPWMIEDSEGLKAVVMVLRN